MPDRVHEPVLRVESLDTGYGGVQALYGVSLDVMEGEVVALIGANGAGKSTLMSAIVGLVEPWAGSIVLRGEDVTRVPTQKRVRRGLALVPEGRLLFGSMTVEENLRLGAFHRDVRPGDAELEEDYRSVYESFPVLDARRRQEAATLSGGEQQMLAIGRALMARPRLLLLDEPSFGLAPKIVVEIFEVLEQLRERGITMLLVEQDARIALKHADRGHVMRTGTIALSGTAEELIEDDDVRLIYLGAWHHDKEEIG